MSESLIKVENVSKKFCRNLKRSLWYGLRDLGNELLGRSRGGNGRLRKDEFWAVENVSFELKRGECLGLIGRNGAGKTTLLRMLNGLIKPDQGSIQISGRVGALIALGAGFNPILTGRENIYVNASVLGVSKKVIDEKFEEIVEFAELSQFIDMPVRSYSSGMQVRLGFSIATQMNPDVLLIDEVLAVGDIGFRLKCYNKIAKLSRNSAIIFVSHSLAQIAKVCNVGLFLNDGNMGAGVEGIETVIERYNRNFSLPMLNASAERGARILNVRAWGENQKLEYEVNMLLAGDCEQPDFRVCYGHPMTIGLDIELPEEVDCFHVLITVEDMEQKQVAQFLSCNEVESLVKLKKEEVQTLYIEIPEVVLNRGRYGIICAVKEVDNGGRIGRTLCQYTNLLNMMVDGGRLFGGSPIQLRASWVLSPNRDRENSAGVIALKRHEH